MERRVLRTSLDLIVWYDARDGEPTGFQLCYNIRGDEHAVTWTQRNGFAHHRVDKGETPKGEPFGGRIGCTPILTPDGVFPFRVVVDRFREAAASLAPEVSELVLNKLGVYPGERGARATGILTRSDEGAPDSGPLSDG